MTAGFDVAPTTASTMPRWSGDLTGMIIGLGTNVVELDDVAALETALNRAVTGDLFIFFSLQV